MSTRRKAATSKKATPEKARKAPAAKKPAAAKNASAKKPAVAKKASAKKPAAATKPAAKKSAAKKSAAAAKTSGAKRPAVKKPAAKKPVVTKPAAAKKPAVKKPAAKKPAAKKPARTERTAAPKARPSTKRVDKRAPSRAHDTVLSEGVVLRADGTLEVQMTVLPSDIAFMEANEAFEAGDYERAFAGYSRALDDVDDPEIFYNRAMTRARLQDFAGAIEDYDRAIGLRTTEAKYFGNRGAVKDAAGDQGGALIDMTRALEIEGPGNAQYFVWRGTLLYQMGHYDDAIADFNAAVVIDPDWKDIFFQKGNAELRAGRSAEAEQSFTADLERDPSSMGHFNRHVARKQLDQHAKALEDLDAAITLAPDSAPLYASRGLLAFELRDFERASEDLVHAVAIATDEEAEIDPKWPLAAALAFCELGRHEEALAPLATAIDLRPDEPSLRSNRGWVLHQLGRSKEAMPDLDHALAVAPEYAKARYNRAAAREALGDRTGALEDYRILSALGDDVEEELKRLGH